MESLAMASDSPSVEQDAKAFSDLVNEMTASVAAARESIASLVARDDLETKDGISLLSMKHHVLLSYLQSLVLLSARRVLGQSMQERKPPSEPFGNSDRGVRGSNPGDIVDVLVEDRVVLEKVKMLEAKMKYQIDKLTKLASDDSTSQGPIDDPLAFRPMPENLIDQESDGPAGDSDDGAASQGDQKDGIYRPPKLAPVPYNENERGSKKTRAAPIPSALKSLSYLQPHVESSSGLGSMPALQSARARELERMTRFEEENFTRLVMKKTDAKRRRRDEEAIALGSTGAVTAQGRRRAGGLADEFNDVIRAVDRRKDASFGDGYDELRLRGKKKDVLARSRTRALSETDDEPRERKKGRFEKQRISVNKRRHKTSK